MNYFNLKSDRLKFRKLTEKDILSWSEFFVGNDRLIYLGLDLKKSNKTQSEEWINRQILRYKEIGLGLLAVELKDSGVFIGMGGIIPRDLHEKSEFEIAYSLKQNYWGKGYATEIAKTMKNYGFKSIDSKRFISIIDIRNSESANVARKNGMNVLFKTEFLGMDVDVFGIEK